MADKINKRAQDLNVNTKTPRCENTDELKDYEPPKKKEFSSANRRKGGMFAWVGFTKVKGETRDITRAVQRIRRRN